MTEISSPRASRTRSGFSEALAAAVAETPQIPDVSCDRAAPTTKRDSAQTAGAGSSPLESPAVQQFPPSIAGRSLAARPLAERLSELTERLAEKDAGLATLGAENATLQLQLKVEREKAVTELSRLKQVAAASGATAHEIYELDPTAILDKLPPDRLELSFGDKEFSELVNSIADHGQDVPITVRRITGDGELFEIAAGRRRLAACRKLGVKVLARVRVLDTRDMLRIQYDENERRQDIGPLERGRWFARVQTEFGLSLAQIAQDFGLAKGTVSDYIALTRVPNDLIEALSDPRVISLNRGRRLLAALSRDGQAALQRALEAIRTLQTRWISEGRDGNPDEEFESAIRAAEGKMNSRLPSGGGMTKRNVTTRDGKPLATFTRSGNQWVLRFAASVDENAVEALAARLPDLLSPSSRAKRRGEPAE